MTAEPHSPAALPHSHSHDDFFVESPSIEMERRQSSLPLLSPGASAAHPSVTLPHSSALYNIEEQIGHGSFGQVFKAWDWQLKRNVVIKQVPILDHVEEEDPKKRAQRAVIEKAAREPEWLEQLDHPAIIKVLDSYEENKCACLVLEYCEGGELFERIKTHGRLLCHIARKVIEQLASALAYSHSCNIAHRDVKPENVVFVSHDPRDLRVKLIDWGMAANIDQMSTLLGTPMYCAPEIMGGKKGVKYSARCDIWSLGVLSYVTLSGKPPFTGTRETMLRDMRAEKYPFPGRPWRNVDPAAKNFVKSLLRADPNRRLAVEYLACNQWLSGASEKKPVHPYPLPSEDDDWGLPDDDRPSTLQRSRRAGWSPAPGAQLYAAAPLTPNGLEHFWAQIPEGDESPGSVIEREVPEFELPESLERSHSLKASPGALLYAPAIQSLQRGTVVKVDAMTPIKQLHEPDESLKVGDDPERPTIQRRSTVVSRPTLLTSSLGPTPLAALSSFTCSEDCVKLRNLKQCGDNVRSLCSNVVCYRI